MIRSLWKALTSLRLTVVCLALGLLLVFLGTLAQVHEGLYLAQERWFRSFIVLRHAGDAWWVPPVYPGGYLIGITLLTNLLGAHLKGMRFRDRGFALGVGYHVALIAVLALFVPIMLAQPFLGLGILVGVLAVDLWIAQRGPLKGTAAGRKLGVNFTHIGIVLLLVGQLATDMLSEESFIRFQEGETRSYSEAHRDHELVFASDSGAGQEEVVSIAEPLVARGGEIAHPKLPFTVRVKDYHINGEVLSHAKVLETFGKLQSALSTVAAQFSSADGLVPAAEVAQESEGRVAVWRDALKAIGETDAADIVAAAKRVAAQPEREAKLREELKTRFQREMMSRFAQQGGEMRFAADKIAKGETITAESLPKAGAIGVGAQAVAIPLPEATSMDAVNFPYASIEIVSKGGQSLGTWFVSPSFTTEQEIAVDGKTYRTAFRAERIYYPFSVTLLKTTHEVYPGTTIPRNYQSRVRLNNPQTREAREVDIFMNNPLRYAGLTFYQSQMDKFELPGFSGLQVVRNPSWLTPYLGCLVVGYGMARHFFIHLLGFMAKRRAPQPKPTAPSTKSRSRARRQEPVLQK